ncbi:MAG: hypothetical protein GXP55_04880, partial [Deltaproteobacteria bacterium]|nr:hypothetical protein [Deltaproteobacteria bacterium]
FFPVLRCANETLGCEPGDEDAQAQYLTGENIRGYFSRLGNTEHATAIAPSGRDGFTTDDPSRPFIPVDLGGAFRDRMMQALPRIEALRGRDGRLNTMSDRMQRLAGTHFETDLLDAMGTQGREMLQAAYRPQDGLTTAPAGVDLNSNTVLNQVSPFRNSGLLNVARRDREREDTLARLNMYPTADSQALYRSRYWEYWAEAFRGVPLPEASIRTQQLYLRMVMDHEMGHSVGLRHNFAGSYDRDNYGDGYFNAVIGDPADPSDDLALPDVTSFDDPANGGNGDSTVGAQERGRYRAELRRVRNARAALGTSNYMTGSTMDYNGDTSDAHGLGRYDRAAVLWSYFDLKEAYTGDPRYSASGTLSNLEQPNLVGRTLLHDYRGGDSCTQDAQCPYAQGSESLSAGQGVFQRCVRNPRNVRLPVPCDGAQNCICSTFDEDFKDYLVTGVGPYNNDVDGDGNVDNYPVSYLFCGDERTNDISWCNRFDAGESFQEQIDHYRRRWEEGYPSAYYRRFRRGGARGGSSIGSIIDAAKIYQHLYFRYFYEPGFTAQAGPLGFNDQYMASIDAMNWFTELVNLPDEGSYRLDARSNTYVHMGEDMNMAGADFSLAPGQGFGMWTKYQDGYFGFYRPERAGVFFDKFFAIYALAIRDWNLSFSLDERFFINFYDLFPVEMTEFFGGLALDNPSWFAPRVVMDGSTPHIINTTWNRGTCIVGGKRLPCLDSQPVEYPQPALRGTSNTVLRSWATILALAQFPVYYDTSFEQRLIIYRLDSGAGFSIPATQADGTQTCAYGDLRVNPTDLLVSDGNPGCTTEEDADYVVYQSPRFHTPYVANKVRSRTDYNLEVEQLGFQLLAQLYNMREEIAGMAPGQERDDLDLRHQQHESFLEYLIDLQAQYGISNTFF